MVHDFIRFPELVGEDLDLYYFQSPHKQIFEDFSARVVGVHDGDTLKLRWSDRNFDFRLRFLNIAAPELKNSGGKESQLWLEKRTLGQIVDVTIDKDNRVEKWGRLLGKVSIGGVDIGEESIINGMSVPWEQRNEGLIRDGIPNFNQELMGASL